MPDLRGGVNGQRHRIVIARASGRPSNRKSLDGAVFTRYPAFAGYDEGEVEAPYFSSNPTYGSAAYTIRPPTIVSTEVSAPISAVGIVM
jgi:hypothetical protein